MCQKKMHTILQNIALFNLLRRQELGKAQYLERQNNEIRLDPT